MLMFFMQTKGGMFEAFMTKAVEQARYSQQQKQR